MPRPVIGITMGDAAGIGPEIIVKGLSDTNLYEICKPIVIGDAKILDRAKKIVRSDLIIVGINSLGNAKYQSGTIDCLDMDLIPANLPLGQVSEIAGDAAYRFLVKAVELSQADLLDAICTAPLNKDALNRSGHSYPGHTEILAELTGSPNFAMMLSSPRLKVILVTIHVGLLDAIRLITPARVHKIIMLANLTLQRMGYSSPRIAVCGINPHAGEQGMFGYNEEEEKILPAIECVRNKGIKATGPLPADTAFYRTLKGEFDVVVAMYHDQGLIPIKTLEFGVGVNITLGLPIIRTSVDHGTAFEIAGKGIADEQNLIVAIKQAVQLIGLSIID